MARKSVPNLVDRRRAKKSNRMKAPSIIYFSRSTITFETFVAHQMREINRFQWLKYNNMKRKLLARPDHIETDARWNAKIPYLKVPHALLKSERFVCWIDCVRWRSFDNRRRKRCSFQRCAALSSHRIVMVHWECLLRWIDSASILEFHTKNSKSLQSHVHLRRSVVFISNTRLDVFSRNIKWMAFSRF